MESLRIEIEGCVQSHAKLRSAVAGLTDSQVASPSLLPGWTVGHVLSHIARNADGMSRRVEAALEGETVDQYIGGPTGRAAEIEAGATRSAPTIVADLTTSAQRLDDLFASVPDDPWPRPVRTVRGDQHPMSKLPLRRWREVEVHLVDLDLGATPAAWPDELVDLQLPRLTANLADRCDGQALMAWILGRGPAPELDPWA